MGDDFRPDSGAHVAELVAWAAAEQTPLEVVGRGSKQGFGRPVQAAHGLDLSALTGITLYEPEELVLGARAGTPLAEIEAALAAQNQHLAFEPPDLGPLLGNQADAGSIGGVLACNLSGPRRLKSGAARDHFLGVEAVSGRGDVFKSGGRVVKNVTGYDLCKLLAGSHGTLAVMTDVTVKVLPRPEKTRTVLVFGQDDGQALAVMTRALQSPHEISGAAHLPVAVAAGSQVSYVAEAGAAGQPVTALRLEGPGPSVSFRCQALRGELADFGAHEELHGRNSALLWREVRDVQLFVDDPGRPVWRLSVPPVSAPGVVARIADREGARHYFDWGGGLIWLALPDGAEPNDAAVRAALAESGGHATLVRAPTEVRAITPVFQPPDPAEATIIERVKDSFDPRRVLNPGRMYAGL
jgi:glycolate dehydrogenase FAD-binding subunit